MAVKKFFSAIWGKYAGYCRKHNFNPVVRLIIFAVITVLLVTALICINGGSKKTVSEEIPGKITKIELKDIGELATQAVYYTSVQTVRNAQELWGWKVPFTETHSIFSYDGVIKVGYDFAEIEIETNDETKEIKVYMPEARILGNDIDPQSLKIYDEEKNIFSPMGMEDFGLKMEQIELESEEAAISRGVFENAQSNAEVLIKGFLSGVYDMNEYTVIFVYEEQEMAE